jgi:signal transduction histidine kinase
VAQAFRDLFEANHIIVLFLYGQVFFVLGLVIALQSWRHSRLGLARNLKWLAAFGITHGLYEWGEIFIPIQESYLAAPLIELLWTAHAMLLALSFACLFQFGVEALRPLPRRWQHARVLPWLILLLWIAWALGPSLALARSLDAWQVEITIIARYSLGFPAAVLAAAGLWRQAAQLARAFPNSNAVHMLRLAALAMAAYSVLSGLIVPPATYPPARWFNTVQVGHILVIPVAVLRGVLGLILATAIIRSLNIFEVELERRLATMEEEQILIAERERLGRELHDGTLQTIYAAGLLLQAVERGLTLDSSAPALQHLQQSITLLNTAVGEIRSHIGALRPAPDGGSLIAGLRELAGDHHLRSMVELDLRLDLPEDRLLPAACVGHLLAITNEALSNIARHANATRASVEIAACAGRCILEIADNGCGFPADTLVGYGLRNMRDRARMLGGELTLRSEPGHGTVVVVDIPWSESHELCAHPIG